MAFVLWELFAHRAWRSPRPFSARFPPLRQRGAGCSRMKQQEAAGGPRKRTAVDEADSEVDAGVDAAGGDGGGRRKKLRRRRARRRRARARMAGAERKRPRSGGRQAHTGARAPPEARPARSGPRVACGPIGVVTEARGSARAARPELTSKPVHCAFTFPGARTSGEQCDGHGVVPAARGRQGGCVCGS